MFLAAIVSAVGIYLGATLSPDSNDAPSAAPSASPSLTFSPSFSPSECAVKISTNRQKIDLPIDDPQFARFAVDGNNMVVVARDGITLGSPVFIFFIHWQMENGKEKPS